MSLERSSTNKLAAMADLSALPTMPATQSVWRTGVTHRGGYWQWRLGSGRRRQSRYGGKFSMLPVERKEAYETNKKKRTSKASHPSE